MPLVSGPAMPNDILIEYEKTDDIELGEINASRLTEVLLVADSKLETSVGEPGQIY